MGEVTFQEPRQDQAQELKQRHEQIHGWRQMLEQEQLCLQMQEGLQVQGETERQKHEELQRQKQKQE